MRIGRFIAVLVALVLAVSTVAPAMVGAAVPLPMSQDLGVMPDAHDHDNDASDRGDLAHFAQSHAQTLTTHAAGVIPVACLETDIRIRPSDDVDLRGRVPAAPDEPPRR